MGDARIERGGSPAPEGAGEGRATPETPGRGHGAPAGSPGPSGASSTPGSSGRGTTPPADAPRRTRIRSGRGRYRLARRAVRRLPPTGLPRALAPLLRAVDVSVGDVAHYWAEERRALGCGLTVVLLTSVTGMIAGMTLAAAESTLERLPGLLLLVPAAIGMRGNIYGALASRLATALHVGAFEFELKRRSFLGRQIEATTLLTLATSVLIAVLSWILGSALGLHPIPAWDLIVVATVGGAAASAVLLVVTVVLAAISQRREWNMDDVGAPTVTMFGDVLTIPALLLASHLVPYGTLSLVLGALLAGVGIWALVAGWRHRDDTVRRIVRESVVTLTFASVVGVLAGTVLQARLAEWLAAPVLLIMLPSFVANCGSLGGILSSRISSKLYLGLLEPTPLPSRNAGLDISVMFLYGIFAFTAIGVAAWIAATLMGQAPPGISTVAGIAIVAGILATLILSIVAYTTAATAYRHGLDPDNQGIPIVTSAMDFLGLLCLLGVASLWID